MNKPEATKMELNASSHARHAVLATRFRLLRAAQTAQ